MHAFILSGKSAVCGCKMTFIAYRGAGENMTDANLFPHHSVMLYKWPIMERHIGSFSGASSLIKKIILRSC
jgi:hypothetical protein